jgi:hypothetical protein
MINMNHDIQLDRTLMLACFEKLNQKLLLKDEHGEIVIFGGASMCLVYGSRGYTRDVDEILQPKSSLYQMAKEVAAEMKIQEDWLNDGIKGFIYSEPPYVEVITYSNLKVHFATADYLLTMKCYAARADSKDKEDAIFLKNYLNLSEPSKVLDIVERYIPHKFLSVRTVAFVEGLFT